MGKSKKVWVRPVARGQMPSGKWTDEGGAPFQVPEGAVSKSWQKALKPAEAKKLDDAAKAAAKAALEHSDGALNADQAAEFREELAELERGGLGADSPNDQADKSEKTQ